MTPVLIKVYGHLGPVGPSLVARLRGSLSLLGSEADNAIALSGSLLNLSHEGGFFPMEEFLAALGEVLAPDLQGRIDYLDLEEWTITRYSVDGGRIAVGKRSLNDVLDYSGH